MQRSLGLTKFDLFWGSWRNGIFFQETRWAKNFAFEALTSLHTGTVSDS